MRFSKTNNIYKIIKYISQLNKYLKTNLKEKNKFEDDKLQKINK